MAEQTVNLQKSYSALNEKLVELFDSLGVRRSFTVPYIEGQDTDEHIRGVAQAASQTGGLTQNLVTTAHHSTGKGWGTGEGHTVGHPGDALRSTVIPKDYPQAKAAIKAAQKHLDNVSTFLGEDDPAVKTAQGQLDLVKSTDAAGMNLLDFGVMMIQVMHAPNQAIARAHNGTKPDAHHPVPTPPRGGAAAPQEQPEAPAGAPAAPEAQGAPEGQSEAPEAQEAAAPAPEAAPAAAGTSEEEK